MKGQILTVFLVCGKTRLILYRNVNGSQAHSDMTRKAVEAWQQQCREGLHRVSLRVATIFLRLYLAYNGSLDGFK